MAAGVVSVGPEDGPSASVREAREALVPLLKTPWEGRPHGPFVRRFSASSKGEYLLSLLLFKKKHIDKCLRTGAF